MSKQTRLISAGPPDALLGRVVAILEQARGNVVRAVNTNMVVAYWLIGREIVQELQGGKERAEYGKKIVEALSVHLTERYGKGFSFTNLWYFRQFYLAFQTRLQILHPLGGEFVESGILHPSGGELTPPQKSYPAGTESLQGFSPHLSWSYYRALMRVVNVAARTIKDVLDPETQGIACDAA